MRRLLSLAFIAVTLVTPLALSTTTAASAHPMCGRWHHWVPGHRNYAGRWVHGHCAPDRR